MWWQLWTGPPIRHYFLYICFLETHPSVSINTWTDLTYHSFQHTHNAYQIKTYLYIICIAYIRCTCILQWVLYTKICFLTVSTMTCHALLCTLGLTSLIYLRYLICLCSLWCLHSSVTCNQAFHCKNYTLHSSLHVRKTWTWIWSVSPMNQVTVIQFKTLSISLRVCIHQASYNYSWESC